MIARQPESHLLTPRRLVGVVAAVALVWAAMFAVIGHSLAMATTPAAAAERHDPAAHDHASHDAMAAHDAMVVADQGAPCENGCSLCKDCSLCTFIAMPAVASIPAPLRYGAYRPMLVALTGGVTPSLPSEPPRV